MTQILLIPEMPSAIIPAMSESAIDLVRQLETEVLKAPQIDMPTQHVLHAGVYARTICLPADGVLTGALIKIATTLIVSGDTTVFTDDGLVRLTGYNVLLASAGRKQAFVAHADTHITMLFATRARTVQEAEEEFTDEHQLLMSRHCPNEVRIGEMP